MRMLPKHFRFHILNSTGEALVGANDGLVDFSLSQWKLVSGVLTFATVVQDDFGIDGSSGSVADGASIEGTAIDNSTNKNWGATGYFNIKTDNDAAVGNYNLYVEYSDDNSIWPSDSDDFVVTDLVFVVALPVDNSAPDKTRAVNFEI